MKKYTLGISSLMLILFASSVFGQGFGTNCPTLEQQQAAFNKSKAVAIVVKDTASQQLQCHYNQLATYFQQLDTSNQQKAKDAQQIAKDIQQKAKDDQQLLKDVDCKKREDQCVKRESDCNTRESQCTTRESQCSNREKTCSDKETALHLKELALNVREADLIKREEACKTPVVCKEIEINPWKDDGKGGLCKIQNGEKWEHNEKGTFIDGIPLEECIKMKGEAALLSDEDYNAFKEEYRKKHTNHSGGADGTNPGGGGNLNGYLNPNNSGQ